MFFPRALNCLWTALKSECAQRLIKIVLFFSEGPARGVMSECYHAYCDTAALNETVPFANIFFLKKTTQVRLYLNYTSHSKGVR